jgi:hypothetical protein
MMMRKFLFPWLGAFAAGMLLAATAAAQNKPAAPGSPPPATPVAAPVVAEQAHMLCRIKKLWPGRGKRLGDRYRASPRRFANAASRCRASDAHLRCAAGRSDSIKVDANDLGAGRAFARLVPTTPSRLGTAGRAT